MEVIVNALVLKATDYGENDKILTLLTSERGKITAGIRGVKKAAAKLKFAAQPFCFAEYVLSKNGERYTVVNATESESFYELREDINRFYAAASVLETACALTYEGEDCAEVFKAAVNALTGLCSGGGADVLTEYLAFLLKFSGYGISAGNCARCGAVLTKTDRLKFDLNAGSFICGECGDGAGASRTTYNVLRKALGFDYEKEYITPDGKKRALRLIREYLSYKLNVACNSLAEYIRLL